MNSQINSLVQQCLKSVMNRLKLAGPDLTIFERSCQLSKQRERPQLAENTSVDLW